LGNPGIDLESRDIKSRDQGIACFTFLKSQHLPGSSLQRHDTT
jgi:hypothetical protein